MKRNLDIKNVRVRSRLVDYEISMLLKTFSDSVQFFLNCKKVLVRNFLFSSVIIVPVLFMAPDVYKAHITFLTPQNLLTIPDSKTIPSIHFVYASLLRSEILNTRVAKKLNLDKEFGVNSIEDAKILLREMSSFDAKSFGINYIDVRNKDPELAQKIATEYFNQVSILLLEMRSVQNKSLQAFVQKELIYLKKELIRDQKKYTAFQEKNSLVNPFVQFSSAYSNMMIIEARLAIIRAEREALSSKYSKNLPQIKLIDAMIESLERKIALIKGSKTEKKNNNQANDYLGLKFSDVPFLVPEMRELYADTEIEIQLGKLFKVDYYFSQLNKEKETEFIKVVDNFVTQSISSRNKAFLFFVWTIFMIMFSLIYESIKNKVQDIN